MTQLNSNGDNLYLLMHAACDSFPNHRLLVDLSVVQAILEGACLHNPPSQLALKYNNLFGIKGLGTGLIMDGKKINTIVLPTHEYYNGEMHEVDQRFAVNSNIEDSFEQHRTLMSLPRYANLWNAQTFEEVADLIYKDGYATDPRYPNELIQVYREYFND